MANKVVLKRSSVSSNAPGTGDLDYGELALNYADGRLYYKTSSNTIDYFVSGINTPNSEFENYQYTATASQTTFSGSDDNSATLSYTAGKITVFINGVKLAEGDYTATNGTSVVLGSGAAADDIVEIVSYKDLSFNDLSAGTGLTYSSGEFAIDSTVATLSGTQTLTNKTLTAPIISSISNTGTLTLPTSTGTVALTSDITLTNLSVTATADELNTLDGITATVSELNTLDGITATVSELNVLDGITATVTELNYTEGVTSSIQTQLDGKLSASHNHTLDSLSNITITTNSAGEILKWDGSAWVNNTLAEAGISATSHTHTVADITDLTATAAELNILDGVTATASELNALDGITATVTELNYTDGVTSNIQTQLDAKAALASPTFTGTVNAANLSLSGNLTVNGTTTTVNSTTVTLDDPIITLGGDSAPSTDDNKDRGVEFRWHNGSAAKVGFFGFDDSSGKLTFIPDATNTSEVFSGTKGTVDANIEWADVLSKPDPTITLGGDLTGSVTLTDLASGTLTATIASIAGAVTLSGGTANGVTYLNGSKVLTSGSALTFDGTNLGIGIASPSTILDVNANTPVLVLRDSRTGGTWSAGTALGKLDFYTSDATGIGPHSIASIGVEAGGSNTASPDGELVFSTGAYNTAASEKMRIDSSGNVGIGVTSSVDRLTIGPFSGNNVLTIGGGTTGNSSLYFGDGPTGSDRYRGYLDYEHSNDALVFGTSSSEKMRIDSSGRVGINTSPSYTLDVNGAANFGANVYHRIGGTPVFATSGGFTYYYGNTNGIAWRNAADSTTQMALDSSGNVGIGVTPSSWASGATAIQLDSYSALFESVSGKTTIAFNARESATNTYNYLQNEAASAYQQVSGTHTWYIAASGTAGNTISFTQAMTLDASGRLGIGTPSPSQKLHIGGSREILFDSTNGAITMSGESGGWAIGLNFKGSGGTNHGGFGAYGASDTLNWYYIGSAYNAADAVVVLDTGEVGIGTTSPSAKLQVVGSSNDSAVAANAIFKVGASGGDGIAMGSFTSSPYGSWIQSGYLLNGYSPAWNNGYPLVLNPAGGNVGIGTTSPNSKLTIKDTTDVYADIQGWGNVQAGIRMRYQSDANAGAIIYYNTPNAVLYYDNTYSYSIGQVYGSHDFRSKNSSNILTSRLYIEGATGNVGIGTTSPAAKLDIHGSSGQLFSVTDSLTGTVFSVNDISGIPIIEATAGSTNYFDVTGEIRATSEITAYYSDERLKEKVDIINNPLDIISSLSAFKYINNEKAINFGYRDNKVQIGLSAQEVQAVLPEIVTLAPFDTKTDNEGNKTSRTGENYLTLDYAKLVPVLIEAIKEQQKQIDELKNNLR